MSEQLAAVTDFLLGRAALDGVWFPDKHPSEPGAYWWRKHLTAALTAPTRDGEVGREAAWREGWADCKASLTDDEAFCLTEDVEQDAWMDSKTRAALATQAEGADRG